jgi:2-haloacid dehalogenase
MAPALALFDVNETLVDLEGLRGRLEQAGAPGHLLETWFAATLRDGIGLAAAGGYADFADVAAATLRALAPEADAEHVLAGLGELDLHPDVADGLRRLAGAGVRIATLTNGSAETTRTLLERGGFADLVERCMSVADARRWKPAPEPYRLACERCAVAAGRVALVAVHPWDVHGARRAGLLGAWLNRAGLPYPPFFAEPNASAGDLPALADRLLGGG